MSEATSSAAAPEDVAALRGYVSADASHDAYLGACWTEAAELVATYLGTAGEATVPAELRRRAVLEVASELFHRRNAPAGVLAQYGDLAAAPVRISRDPMVAAYPLLTPYVAGGFG